MAQTLDDFIGQFNGGYRPNKFRVQHSFPAGDAGANALIYHIRAASFPASTMTTINVPYRGRIFKMPGIRTYATWQITVLDDTNDLHAKYHAWSAKIKGHKSNTSGSFASNGDFTTDMKDITVTQLAYNGQDDGSMTLIKAWPSNVGPLQFDMENNDTILTFTVDFEFQYSKGPGAVV